MPGGTTGPARRQGTHHPPPNRLADEADSTTDEEPCRPRRPGVNGDRRMPHIRRSFNSAQQRSLRSPLTLELLGLARQVVVATCRASMYSSGGCHTPTGHSTQRSSGLSGHHSRSNCHGRSRRIAVSEVAVRTRIAMSSGMSSGERACLHLCLYNRSIPNNHDDQCVCHDRHRSQKPCHHADRYSRYNRNTVPMCLADLWLWQV